MLVTSVPSDSVYLVCLCQCAVCVCVWCVWCVWWSLVLGRVSMRFRTSPATPHRLGLCQRSVFILVVWKITTTHLIYFRFFFSKFLNRIFFFSVIVWFHLEISYPFWSSDFLVSVVFNHNRIGFPPPPLKWIVFILYLLFLFFFNIDNKRSGWLFNVGWTPFFFFFLYVCVLVQFIRSPLLVLFPGSLHTIDSVTGNTTQKKLLCLKVEALNVRNEKRK